MNLLKVYDKNHNITKLTIFNNTQIIEKQLFKYSQYVDVIQHPIKTIFIKYYDNGNIKSIEIYNRTFEDNYIKYKKGEITLKQLYRIQNNYMKNGKHKYFYKDGTIKQIITWNNDKLVSNLSYVNQQLINGLHEEIIDGFKTICDYKNGIKNGKMTIYYDNGTIKKIENYENNIKHGEFIEFFETGIIKNKNIYNNNELIMETNYYNNGNVKTNYDFQSNVITFYNLDGKILDIDNDDLPEELKSYLFSY